MKTSVLRNKSPEQRRAELIRAAKQVFVEKGMEATVVSDIVKAAGVAQGTFYLYFKTKTDILAAVAEHMAEEVSGMLESLMQKKQKNAVQSLASLGNALVNLLNDPASAALTDIFHKPENRAIHDLLAGRLIPRMLPLMEGIIRQGMAEGVFTVKNPKVAAWFVLSGFHGMEEAFPNRDQVNQNLAEAVDYALRALGFTGRLPVHKSRRMGGEL